jgi:uncharacterized protein Veg
MKKSFIPLTALALLALVSCGGNNKTSSESKASSSDSVSSSKVAPSSGSDTPVSSDAGSSSEEAVYNSVTINKKDELTADWHVGDSDRTLDITIDPVGNVNALIKSGVITITSSDDNVISIKGKVLTAVSAGKATITVTYGDKTDSVEITTLAKQTAIVEYGTVHEGTETDPLDNEDAITVAEKTGMTATTKYYYVKGVVASFKEAPSSYGNVSYYLEPATKDGKKFLVYRVKGIDGAKVTEDDIWVGATVTAKVKIVNYNNNTPETEQGGNLTKVEGTKPVVETIEATVAEALTACKALDPNSMSTNKYVITGYIVDVTSTGFYMSDTKGEITGTNDDFFVYGYSGDNADKCTLNAKIKITTTLKYYKSTTDEGKYNYQAGKIDSLEILEEGDAAAEIESINVATGLEKIAALDDGAYSNEKYDVTGYIVEVTYAYTASNGISFTIADTVGGTDVISVFKATLADGIDSAKLVSGAQVKIRGGLCKYVKDGTVTPEIVSGTITELLAEAVTPEAKTINATVAEAVTAAKALTSKSTSTDNYVITGYVTTVSGAWDSEYGNMSFYMSDTLDDPDAEFIAYQVKCTEEVSKTIVSGAKVKVTGKLYNFSGTPETEGKGAATVELVEATPGASVVAEAPSQVEIGKTAQITVTAQDGVTFGFKSSDEDVATVADDGSVTGVKEGKVTITVTASTGRKAYVDIEVVDKIYPSTTIESFTNVNGNFGETGYTYASAKESSGTAPGVNGGAIRLYQNGATFTIAGSDTATALRSIRIVSDGQSAGEGPFSYVYGASAESIGDAVTSPDWSDHTQTINFDETAGVKYFKLTTTGTTKTTRVYIKSLILTFVA